MKLYFNKDQNAPIYYLQQTLRNGTKIPTRNVKRLGRPSELLKITADPWAYVCEEIRKMNVQYSVGGLPYTMIIDFNERLEADGSIPSSSGGLNIGYYFRLSPTLGYLPFWLGNVPLETAPVGAGAPQGSYLEVPS